MKKQSLHEQHFRPWLLLAVVAFLLLAVSGNALAQMQHADQVASGGGDMFAYWLSNSIVRTVLLIIGIAGVVIEILTVGSFGVFGGLGVISFLLYFWSSFQMGDLTTLAIWLMIGGLVLILLEIFVIPGFGVAGVLGITAMFTALVLAGGDPGATLISLVIAIVVAIGIIIFTLKNRKTRKFWNKLSLGKKLDSASGYDSIDPTYNRYLNKQGVAATTLRPAGTADIDGERVDVVTRGEFIDPGKPIEVILVEGMRIVVREIINQAE